MANPLLRFEIAGRDGDGLASFYDRLFDWQIERREIHGHAYDDIDTGDSTEGGIRHEPEGHAEVVLYFAVENLDEAFEKAKALGAEVRIAPMATPEIRFALVADPEGNPLGLVERS